MIYRLSYVCCDICHGNPAQPADNWPEARRIARAEGYVRQGKLDVCRACQSPSATAPGEPASRPADAKGQEPA